VKIPALTTLLAVWIFLAQAQVTVPVDQEPQHKVAFKNDYVRVIDATLPPGYVTLNHTHATDNVSVTISNGRDGDAGQRGIGRAGFSKGGYSHTVTNSTPGIMRYIVVEVLKADRPGPAIQLAKHTVETENDRVRIYRVKLAPGESLQSHSHGSGWVEVTVGGGAGAGASVWHAAGDASPFVVGANDKPLEIVEVEPK